MKIKSNVGFVGAGLIGTLVFTLGSLTIALGSLKLNTKVFNTANVQSIEFSEDILKQTVETLLKKDSNCQDVLTLNKVTQLPATGRHILETGQDFKNEGFINIMGMDIPPAQENPEAPPIPPQETKRLLLYYTKPTLGANQTRPGFDIDKCTSEDKTGCYYISCEITPDCQGVCDKDYSNLTSCAVTCSVSDEDDSSFTSCTDDQLLKGTKSCTPVPANNFKSMIDNIQDSETYLMGVSRIESKNEEENNNNEEIEELQLKSVKLARECPPGQYPIRILKDGEIEVECQIMCTGGSNLCKCPDPENKNSSECSQCRHNSPLQRCECPSDKPKYKKGVCVACSDINPDLEWDHRDHILTCVCKDRKKLLWKNKCYNCPAGTRKIRVYNKDGNSGPNEYVRACDCLAPLGRSIWKPPPINKCICGGNKKYYKKNGVWDCHDCEPGKFIPHGAPEMGCITCPAGTTRKSPPNDRGCKCNDGVRIWYPSENKCKCHIGNYYQNTKCLQCPYDSQWDNRTKKCKCNGDKSWHYSPDEGINKCISCPIGATWDSIRKRCVCPPKHRDDNGVCCPSSKSNAGGICCPHGRYENAGGTCCPTERFKPDGTCCPEGKYNVNGICCTPGERNVHGVCCPVFRYVNSNTCCPVGQRHDNGICCSVGKFEDNGICCEAGKNNVDGICCVRGHEHNAKGHCCPTARFNSQWKFCCPAGTTHRNGICCPHGTTYDNGVCCRSGSRNDNGICCPHGSRNVGDGACCPHGSNYVGGGCRFNCAVNQDGVCCRSGWHVDNGKCCPASWHNSNGKCCPPGNNNKNGICCPDGWDETGGQCCPGGYHLDNGVCCPPGYQEDKGACCPQATPHYQTDSGTCSSCTEDQVVYNGQCYNCGSGKINYGGYCCKASNVRQGRCCNNSYQFLNLRPDAFGQGNTTAGSTLKPCCSYHWYNYQGYSTYCY